VATKPYCSDDGAVHESSKNRELKRRQIAVSLARKKDDETRLVLCMVVKLQNNCISFTINGNVRKSLFKWFNEGVEGRQEFTSGRSRKNNVQVLSSIY
jgi:hypothetical protein